MAKKATRRRGAGGPPLGVSTLSQPENRPVLMQDALADRYLSYALSTIRSRALPDVRDGLKPVHRRILWGMRLLKLYPEDGYKKSARIVGDVMGKYHPHGDSSIYDALVRQAQDFSMRYPLVDGQGNFGNIDGDSAAAMRYTESRLTPFGAAMMEGIDRGAISFRENYDQTDNEPVVMPSAFPNMLANGSLGIAVGMATSIPSFNMAEIFACLRMLLSLKLNERRGDHIAAIAAMMPGPDLATGGVLIEPTDSIIDAYRTGRGGFLVRARWTIDRGERGAWSVLVNEIPYGISKQTLVEAVGTLIENKVLPDIENIIDESAEDLRIRIVPRSKNINPDVMMERLFQKSSFQVRIPLNMNALVKSGEPVVMSIQDMMLEYIEHRRDVLLSMTHYRLHEIADRLEIIAAQRIVFNNLDEVIRIVRDEEHPGPVLQERFSLSDRQVQYVLDTRLRSLRRLEELAMDREDAALRREAQQLGKLLESPARQDKELIRQIDAAEASFAEWEGWGRRTTITSAPQVEVPVEEVPETGGVPTTVACSLQGWMRAARGHGLTDDVFTWRDGDNAGVRAELGSFDRVSFLVSNGRFYNLPVSAFPLKGAGDPIRLAVSGIGPNDNVLSLGTVSDPLLAVSSDGYAIRFNDGATTRKAGKVAMTFPEGESVALVSPVVGTPDSLAIWTGRGRLLVIDMADIPEMQKGRGVRIDRQRPHGILPFVRKEGLPIVVDGGDTQVIKGAALTRYVGKRGQGGMMLPKGFVGFGVLPPA